MEIFEIQATEAPPYIRNTYLLEKIVKTEGILKIQCPNKIEARRFYQSMRNRLKNSGYNITAAQLGSSVYFTSKIEALVEKKEK